MLFRPLLPIFERIHCFLVLSVFHCVILHHKNNQFLCNLSSWSIFPYQMISIPTFIFSSISSLLSLCSFPNFFSPLLSLLFFFYSLYSFSSKVLYNSLSLSFPSLHWLQFHLHSLRYFIILAFLPLPPPLSLLTRSLSLTPSFSLMFNRRVLKWVNLVGSKRWFVAGHFRLKWLILLRWLFSL